MSKMTGKQKVIAEWLEKIGIDPNSARRVVIDIPCDGAVVVYIEAYGDSSIFEVEPPPELRTAIRVTQDETELIEPKWSEDEIEEAKRIIDSIKASGIILPAPKRKSNKESPIDESIENAIQWINKWEGIE